MNKSQNTINNYINHIVFVLDESSSMSHLQNKVIDVTDKQIAHLAARSKELDQETRVSVYNFAETTRNVVYDKDVLRLPSLRNHYSPNGCTALIAATRTAISDLQQTAQLYGDHAFLIYVLTDGENNRGNNLANTLKKEIEALPDNWTLAVLVPDQNGVFSAKSFGFPAQNISVWDATSAKGVEDVGSVVRKATDTFMTNRSLGIRGSKSLFTVDAKTLTKSAVSKNLDELKASEFELIPVRKDSPIREYVEKFLGSYTVGSGYYQLTKKETVQTNKNVCIRDKKNGKVYAGDNARKLLGLPDFEVKVAPETHGAAYDIYIQSNSVNRKLVKGTDLIILK
jgi:hypothetical protein